ncbi:sodium:solute symporter family protein [Cardinium endosymbiont of Culicoides punctatus]|uniref:sodium:solute symporter family protein n=1 Tax=Cardinium endosymbiont of Culicoides punctatus TaxID=2304601 RepID=UPI001058ECF4|nr:sodium:solute symporter family protein [Cardinium endosymbiont of Culicoides punctatus]TDG95783.1 Bifunctional (p)ppGpp synthase/hydrolase RelA [Cardinium endosymbiont of Culicoides punctatus]
MNTDLMIVSIFLIVTLVIGFYCGRGVTTFRDYAIGRKKMSSFVLTVSLIATTYGGIILNYRLDALYREGFYAFIRYLASAINFYLATRFVIVRMKEFTGHFSVAESMGSIYGLTVRMFSAIFGIMLTTALIASQFKVGLRISTILYPEIEKFPIYSAMFLAGLVILYSTFGGARAVAFTDVYQFFFFGICCPILICAFLYYAKNPLENWRSIQEIPEFNIKKMLVWDEALKCSLTFLLWRSIFPLDPARIQRFYMSSSVYQARKVYRNGAIVRAVLVFVFFSVALALHLGGHKVSTNQNVLDYIIELSYFPGMRGVLITAIIALLMSTADSNLHAASILFANDVLPVLTGKIRDANYTPSLRTVRIASVFIGFISLFVVLQTTNISQLMNKTVHLYGPAVTVPLIMSCFGFRPRSAAVLLTMLTSSAITLYRISYKAQDISQRNVFESLILSMIILFIYHYFLPKLPNTGWVGIKDRSAVELQNQETKYWWTKQMYNFKTLFTRQYRESLFPKKERSFILWGMYFILNTLLALCFIQKDYFNGYIYWYIAVMAIGTILIAYPSFDIYNRKPSYIYFVWPVLLVILLFVSSIQFAKLGNFVPMACALLICHLAASMVFFSLKVSIATLVLSIVLHKFIPPVLPWESLWNTLKWEINLEFIIAGVLSGISITGFGVYKYIRERMDVKLRIIELARSYERRISLEAIYNQVNWHRLDPTHGSDILREIGKMLEEPYQYLYANNQEKLGESVNLFMRKLSEFSNLLLQRAKEERSLKLRKKAIQAIAIKPIIFKAHNDTCNLDESMQLLLRNKTKTTILNVDPDLFERLLTINFLGISTSEQAIEHVVILTIADTSLRYNYVETNDSSENDTLTLTALAFCISTDSNLPNISPLYDITNEVTSVFLPKTEAQLYQAESRQIVQAHGGYVEIIETKNDLTCLYILPVSGEQVMHFKTYDPATLASEIAETPESLIQEKELITLLTAETTLSKETVEKTIAFIKNAHGLIKRKSGEPYYTHLMAVAKILLDVTKDPETILAGLLHDIVEDTPVTLSQIQIMYGNQIAYIVDMVTHYKTNGYRWKLDDKENKNILYECKDIRVIYAKLADRLHNLRTIHFKKPEDQKRIAKETITFYIPWGKSNNVSVWLSEMQHICEKILNIKK